MWIHNINPTLLHLGPLEIRWYGLVYVLGFFIAIWWLIYSSKKGKINLTKNEAWDFVFYLMVGVIIGSRLFEVFWETNYYLSNPLNFFKVWQGGMSFHGGLVGIMITAYIYCKKKKLNYWKLADVLSIPAMFALAVGRIANFINGELVGRVFNGKWCVVFPDYDDLCRHPSTLYAAGKRFIVLGWLMFLSLKEKSKPGFIFWNFVLWEGLGRFIVDFFREDKMWFSLTVGQWFSIAMVIISLVMFIKYYKEDWRKIIK